MDIQLLYAIIIASLLLLLSAGTLAAFQVKIYKLKRNIYFIKRDRERCNELLFTSKDGFFCFVYPDQKIKDPQKGILEKCSRRLSVMLNLKNGTTSSFKDVLDMFIKEDSKLLDKYVLLLQQEGKAFDDILQLKKNGRYFCVYGNRVHGVDSNLYCDIVWFRDVSEETDKLLELENEKNDIQEHYLQLEKMIDGLNYPVWLRDENLKLKVINKKYIEYTAKNTKTEIIEDNVEINNNKGEAVSYSLALLAQKSKKLQKKSLNIIQKGEVYNFELYENPYYIGDTLDKIGTVGYLTDKTELEKAKRNFKINQNTHLEILGVLGTAFAIFDTKSKLYFYNSAFKELWNLENDFLDKTPKYMQFIEVIREQKMLPPVPDFKNYKEDEMSVFSGLIDTKEDLLHLPDGRTIRRLRTPHPNGVIFAFEDVSDRLATQRRLNDLTSMQQNILDNLTDSVIIFGANQRLKFYNRAYLKLWGIDYDKVQDEPKLDTMISYQKLFFSDTDDWNELKASIMTNILSGNKFSLSRDDDVIINVSPMIFHDGSIMITYTVK